MLICRVLPIQCLCRICWCFEVGTLGEFSTPCSPLWRILGTLSGLGIVNPSQQQDKTVAHAPTIRFSQNAAYWGPAPWHCGIDLLAHWSQVLAGNPVFPFDFRPARFSMTHDSCRGYVAGFCEWLGDWCVLCPRDLGRH